MEERHGKKTIQHIGASRYLLARTGFVRRYSRSDRRTCHLGASHSDDCCHCSTYGDVNRHDAYSYDADTETATTTSGGDKPFAGKTVTIFGVAADEQAQLFQQEFDAFEARTGIDVKYDGNKDFETLIRVRVEGNNAPDIAQFAQPGLLASFVNQGKVVDLNSFMDKAMLEKQYSKTFLDLATVNGKMAGLWHNNDVKSLVWYPKDDFDAKGYKIPTTWDELTALTEKIAADGTTPWCIGIEFGGRDRLGRHRLGRGHHAPHHYP